MIAKPPVVVVIRDPFRGPRPEDAYEVVVGATIADLAPNSGGKPLVCCMLGTGYLLREDWTHEVQPGEILVFEVNPPQNRDALRGILQIVLTLAATYFLGPWGAAAAIFVGSAAINALLPQLLPKQADPQTASPTYSTNLSGNIARLNQPIPRICGRHKVTPPFAAQPYVEFRDNDQYYYALLCVGIGNHMVEATLIDDTPLSHFSDVLVSRYLPPGTLPTDVLANVATAPEVAGQDMVRDRYIGGFAACAPRKRVTHIGIDIAAPRGLGYQLDDGSMGNWAIEWRVEVRPISDFGQALGSWAVLGTESRVAATVTPQRWSFKYALPEVIRPEIRVMRTPLVGEGSFDFASRALEDAQWVGMRAYLDEDAPLHPDAAHFEVVLRASDQLSALSQRNICLIVQSYARPWHPDTGWGAEILTRNPAWWLADLWSNGVWGEGLPDNRIDLQTLYDLSLVWEARQDRFDFVFDTSTDAWEAAQLIAGAGRARAFRRYGVNTLARDQLETLPVTAFTPRNCVPDSMVLNESLPTGDTPDGVTVEYFDLKQWDWLPIDCPCPGVEEMENPIVQRKVGITGRTHAEREGRYEAASLLYRTRRVSCTTEMQGMLPAFMSPVRWQPEIVGYGQSGDVAHWDADTLTMGLTEPVTWGDAPIYLTLIRDDGTLTTPVAVSPGPTANDVLLPAAPDFALVVNDSTRERPKYLLGPLDTCDELVKISAISDGGKNEEAQLFNIEAVVDDSRVHAADNALLPGPGVIQDPIDPTVVPPETYFANIVNRGEWNGPGESNPIRWHSFKNDGTEWIGVGPPVLTSDVQLASQWLIGSPVEPGTAALFDIYVTSDRALNVSSDATDTWLNLGTTRTFESADSFVFDLPTTRTTLNVQIRETATGIVQDSATIVIV